MKPSLFGQSDRYLILRSRYTFNPHGLLSYSIENPPLFSGVDPLPQFFCGWGSTWSACEGGRGKAVERASQAMASIIPIDPRRVFGEATATLHRRGDGPANPDPEGGFSCSRPKAKRPEASYKLLSIS